MINLTKADPNATFSLAKGSSDIVRAEYVTQRKSTPFWATCAA